MKKLATYLLAMSALLLAACSATKYVPDGKYLLDKVVVRSDVKDIPTDDIEGYIRQTPNTSVLGLWKMQVNVYSLSGRDTTKAINRFFRKLGTAPEIYDPDLTYLSRTQIERFMCNKGYYEAVVTDSVDTHRRKRAKVIYTVRGGTPYTIRHYSADFDEETLKRIASDSVRTNVREGMRFDVDKLADERTRIASAMHRRGYFNFDKDFLSYRADSALGSHEVDVTIGLRPYILSAADSLRNSIFVEYKVGKVVFILNPTEASPVDELHTDTLDGGYTLVYHGRRPYLRASSLVNNCLIVPGQRYNERMTDRTYESLNKLGLIRYVNIFYQDRGDSTLTCYVNLTPNKKQAVAFEVEGTYSAGDLGVGGSVGYTHRNPFRGAEELSLKAHTAYEWHRETDNDIEVGAEASLKLPHVLFPFLSTSTRQRLRASTNLNVNYNLQMRAEEYNRQIAGAGIQYTWEGRRSPFHHTIDLLDFNYVYLPWISDAFRDYFINDQSIMRYSFEDHFIMRIGYSGSYSTYSTLRPLANYFTLRYGVETAGNLLYGLNHLFHSEQADDGSYKVFNIRYSQYAKADFDLVAHQIFSDHNRFVYHLALGVGVPYGNANSLPFEKRYYAGGANSVRGWSVRTLGPGTYKSRGNRIDINNQTGDIRFDFNWEYRAKLFWKLDAALFVDAGNVWTIRDYESQPGGRFEWNEFYKQIAVAYGLGLRLDFSFFVFRIDYGIKLHDPAYTGRDRWRMLPTWKDDMAFHFAIGYPF